MTAVAVVSRLLAAHWRIATAQEGQRTVTAPGRREIRLDDVVRAARLG